MGSYVTTRDLETVCDGVTTPRSQATASTGVSVSHGRGIDWSRNRESLMWHTIHSKRWLEIQVRRHNNKKSNTTQLSHFHALWTISVLVLCMIRLTMSSGGRGRLVMKFFLHNSDEAILV